MLAVAGKLNLKLGGPSVMVPIDADMVLMLKRPQYWVPTRDPAEYDRRTLYMIYKRNLRLPFDGSVRRARHAALLRPPRAIHARPAGARTAERPDLQRTCRRFRRSACSKSARTTAERIDYAWRLAAGRLPTASERRLAGEFLAAAPDDPARVKEFALAVFNLNAFLYVN